MVTFKYKQRIVSAPIHGAKEIASDFGVFESGEYISS